MPESPRKQRLLGGVIAGAITAYGIIAKRSERQRLAAAAARAHADPRGRRADWPSEIPRTGWLEILKRIGASISRTNAMLMAAGVGFYAFLAIPAAFTAIVSLYGLAFDPHDVTRQLQGMRGVIPPAAITLLSDQLQSLTSRPRSALGVGLIISLIIALWSARSATASMISAINIAYGETEKRSILVFEAVAFILTCGGVVFVILAIALVAILPAFIGLMPLGRFGKEIASAVRWPVLVILLMAGLAAIYRFAPSRERAKWRWVSWGAAVATLLWIVGSALFSIYVGEFASYDKTYGSLGAVVVLLMWLFLSAFAVLLGATFNAEIEHQTARDSTDGPPQPMGRRGAVMADTLGDSQ